MPDNIDASILLERRLQALESVHDCKVIPRRVAGESGQGTESRTVAYVAPAWSVRPDCIDEWVKSLHRQCSDESASDVPPLFDLIAVSRLPLTGDGQIDEAALACLPVLDSELTRRWEDRLKSLPGVENAMVSVELQQPQLPSVHYSELFSEPPAAIRAVEQPAEQPQAPPSNAPAERRLAISHGAALEAADQLPRLLGETLQRAARQHPDHGLRTIVDGAEQFLSYPELLAHADCLLGGLRRAGLRPGDRVIFQLIHNWDLLAAFWACVLGGFVPAPLAPAHEGMDSAADKLPDAFRILDAPLVLTTRELAPRIRATLGLLNLPKARVECVEELAASVAARAWHTGEPTDVALVMLTSGSTGMPKAVMLSHRNLIRRSAASVQMNGFSSDAVTLNWMPLDHVAGIVYFHLRDVFLGCHQIHAATDLVTQDPLIWPEWVDRYRVTITFAPNFAFGLVNDRSEELAARAHIPDGAWDLSCLRYLLNGAEAIVPRTARRFLQILAPYGLSPTAMWPVWGMSETSSGTIYSETFRLETSRDDDPFVEVGRPIPGFSLRIVDQSDQPIFEGAIGSLQVKGDEVMAGYYNRPDLTAESFTADGWFKTGDLGFLSHGRLTITGREKDVIVINSVNYPCHEVEGLVEEIDGIETSYTAACAVRDSGANTDRLAIFFHPVAGCETVSPELIRTIRAAVSRRLGVSPDYLLPVERDAIPKTNIGKIQRPQLAKNFAEGKFTHVVRRVEVLLGGANTLPDWFFRPVWRRAALRGWREVGPMLVFADSLGLGECLQRKAVAAGYQCVLVLRGSEFLEDGDRLTIDSGDSEHYRRAMDALTRRGFEPRSIVHLWTYGEDPIDGVLSVLRLAQALGAVEANSRPRVQLTVVSNQLQYVAAEFGSEPSHDRKGVVVGKSARPHCTGAQGSREAPAFEKAPLLGLLKTIPQENPMLACSHLGLPLAGNEQNAALILSEVSGQTRDAEVAYRGGCRWVRRLRRADLAAEPAGPLPIERGGLYLLSGGLGGIGLEVAGYLLKHFQPCLILVGRTELGIDSGDRSDALRSLEALAATTGGSALYATVDVGDLEGLRDVASRTEKRFGRMLAGVFHLAGLYHESTVAEETARGFGDILHPKLKGALALHRLLAERPGALFVSFSSVNGFMGGYGVSAYAAGNAFLESFSEYQRVCTQVNAYCVSWSLWDDVGMSRGYVMKDVARGRGFYAISARQGLASLLAVLQRPPGHTLVGLDGSNLHVRRLADDSALAAQSLAALVTGDSNTIARLTSRPSGLEMGIRDSYGSSTHCHVKKAPQAIIGIAGEIDRKKGRFLSRTGVQAAGELVRPADELESAIAGVWREVLRVDQLSVTDNFFDLGGSSLAMGQANGRLQETLKRKISMTETFQYTTVRTLAAYLSNSNQAGNAPELGKSQSRGERRREMVRGRRRGEG
jgi:acyl-CoA synthetase (AMP-forming)/AMP-acid ligase II/NAD(P)-dependent dehydrogenase (short-subunit alcohol dehydrogenase family)